MLNAEVQLERTESDGHSTYRVTLHSSTRALGRANQRRFWVWREAPPAAVISTSAPFSTATAVACTRPDRWLFASYINVSAR